MGVGWYLTAVLIGIFLMVSDVERLFVGLFVYIYFLWRNIYPGPLPIFELSCLVFLLSFKSSLHILDLNPLLNIQFANFSTSY